MDARTIDRGIKYDRQIRLWATDGQARLEQAHVCLINANPAGTEALKNLVLPGVGAFTVIDSRIVGEDDLSGNFFLEADDVGKNMAGAVTVCLQELNPDVKGDSLDSPFEEVVRDESLWKRFSMVIVSGYVEPKALLELRDKLWQQNIPLLLLFTSGFYGYVHIVTRQTTVVDTHDPSKTYDLRIDCPWPELTEFSSSFDLASLDDTEHAHVPYIVIFIKALEKWKALHEGSLPVTYLEKKEFRSDFIEKMSRNINLEPNFIEASRSVHRALQVTRIPNSVVKLFERNEVLGSVSGLSDFWLHVRALKAFTEANDGRLPLPGNIPDMASTTSSYVQLQAIYNNKASIDKKNFVIELERVYKSAGRSVKEISPDYVASFCKNASFLHVSEGTKLLYTETLLRQLKNVGSDAADCVHNDLAIYFGLLALQQWQSLGAPSGFEAYVSCYETLTSTSNAALSPTCNTLKEIFHHHSPNYHNICSFIGGVAGQEALKIATAQYIPLDNLFIFDGIRSTSSKWKV